MTGARLTLVTLYTDSDAAGFLSLAWLIICRHVHVWEYALLTSQNSPYETHVESTDPLVFVMQQCMCVCVSVCANMLSSSILLLSSFVDFDFRAASPQCAPLQ